MTLLDDDGRGGRGLPVTVTVVVIAIGTALCLAFHYAAGAYLGIGYPWNTFLFRPSNHFMDFVNMYHLAQHFGRAAGDQLVYSPLLHLLMRAATLVPMWVAFGVLVAAFLATVLLVVRHATALVGPSPVRVLHVAVVVLMSYPVLFVIDRGNLEMLVFIFLAAFFYLYFGRKSGWAWLPLALAIAAKYYWVTLLVLPLLDRRYRQAFLAFAGAVVATVVSVPLIAISSHVSVAAVIAAFRNTIGGHLSLTGTTLTVTHGHSLWGVFRTIDVMSDFALSGFSWVRPLYMAIALALFLIVVYHLARYSPPGWVAATLLVVCAIVLPFENADYTLIHLLLPWSMFAAAASGSRRPEFATAALFGLMFIPLDYYYLMIGIQRSSLSISVLIYPALLLVLSGVLIQSRAFHGERRSWREILGSAAAARPTAEAAAAKAPPPAA